MASSSKGAVKLAGLGTKKIESPLAKYNSAGQLTCVVCNAVVKSEMVWTAHINGKQHKEQVAALKKLKQPAEPPQFAKPQAVSGAVKRKGDTDIVTAPSPSKKGVPADFLDSAASVPKPASKPIKSILKNAPRPSHPPITNVSTSDIDDMDIDFPTNIPAAVTNMKQEEMVQSKQGVTEHQASSGDLPEGFFDDPKLDAKVRQIEFKDPVEEEWEKFQKEIHDEVLVSTAIQEEDQEEATAERQLEEIEEQMINWNRVLQLEQKKEVVIRKLQATRTSAPTKDDESSGDEADLDELFDWRSKAT